MEAFARAAQIGFRGRAPNGRAVSAAIEYEIELDSAPGRCNDAARKPLAAHDAYSKLSEPREAPRREGALHCEAGYRIHGLVQRDVWSGGNCETAATVRGWPLTAPMTAEASHLTSSEHTRRARSASPHQEENDNDHGDRRKQGQPGTPATREVLQRE